MLHLVFTLADAIVKPDSTLSTSQICHCLVRIGFRGQSKSVSRLRTPPVANGRTTDGPLEGSVPTVQQVVRQCASTEAEQVELTLRGKRHEYIVVLRQMQSRLTTSG